MLEKIEDERRTGQQELKWLGKIMNSMTYMNLRKLQEIVEDRSLACCSPWGHKEFGHDFVTEQQSNHRVRTLLPRVPTFLPSASCTSQYN